MTVETRRAPQATPNPNRGIVYSSITLIGKHLVGVDTNGALYKKTQRGWRELGLVDVVRRRQKPRGRNKPYAGHPMRTHPEARGAET